MVSVCIRCEMRNSRGANTSPWGTELFAVQEPEIMWCTAAYCDLFVKRLYIYFFFFCGVEGGQLFLLFQLAQPSQLEVTPCLLAICPSQASG